MYNVFCQESSRNGVSLSNGALWGEPGIRAPLLVTPEDMLSKTVEIDVCFHRSPLWAKMEGLSFSSAFERRDKFCYWWEFYKEFANGTALSLGALLGFVFLDFIEQKRMHIWIPFPWTQRTLKLSLGAIWNFSKEQGCNEMVFVYWGTNGPLYKA
jgi:hypothetical protein